MAIGGDRIEIETAAPFDGSVLRQLELVREVDQDGPSHLQVTVDDASTALPDVVQAVTDRGAEVTTAREVRPSFDTVFATLVERQRAEAAAAAEASTDEAA
jgi:hypothetical protein